MKDPPSFSCTGSEAESRSQQLHPRGPTVVVPQLLGVHNHTQQERNVYKVKALVTWWCYVHSRAGQQLGIRMSEGIRP